MRALLWLLKKYNYVLVFIFLEALALVMLSNNNSYQRSVLVNFTREISGRIFDRTQGAREYFYLRKNNEVLVRENAVLRNKLEQLARQTQDTLTGVSKPVSRYFYTSAHVTRSSTNRQYNYLTIDKGKKQGITQDMGVIGDEGIVGIVLASSANFSTILPVINRDFRLSVKVKRNDFSGILLWEGDDYRQAALNEIPYHATLMAGDTIVTSGFSAVFPEGLFVGTINAFSMKEGNFYHINVDLGTDFQRLFHVNVINNFTREEQLELQSTLSQE